MRANQVALDISTQVEIYLRRSSPPNGEGRMEITIGTW